MKKSLLLSLLLFLCYQITFSQTLDSTYGTNGMAAHPVIGSFGMAGLQQPTNRLVIFQNAGFIEGPYLYFQRFLNDGSVDSSFANHGTSFLPLPQKYNTVFQSVIQPDNKIVACIRRSVFDEHTDFCLLRVKPNGRPDSTFGPNADGYVTTDVHLQGANSTDKSAMILLQPDGKIVLGGISRNATENGHRAIALIRYLSNGIVDTSFGVNGIFTYTPPSFLNPDEEYSFGALQSDGKILFANYNIGIIRVTANGKRDYTFGDRGFVHPYADSNNYQGVFNAINVLSDNGFYVNCNYVNILGQSTGQTAVNLSVYKFKKDGKRDSSFADSGRLVLKNATYTHFTFDYSYGFLSPSEKLLVIYDGSRVHQYKADGTLDSSFGNNGILRRTLYNGELVGSAAILFQPNGKMLVSGSTPSDLIVIERYNPFNTLKTNVVTPSIVKEPLQLKPYKLYPNPASDFITISGLNDKVTSLMTITSADGTTVKQLKINSSSYKCNISSLISGIYYVNIGNGNTLPFMKK